jgi:glycosyltransferase involved in cell wall biosynthesis
MRGTYDGVEYKPFYFFNPNDNFNTLIAWRTPSLFNNEIRAKKKIVWLHDIAYPQQFNPRIIENTDKFIFLSKWHRNNMPSIPDEKIFISNNGINPDDFKVEVEKKPYSMFWGSSYDRGLLPFIQNIFPLIKKELPEATLNVYYGWQNIDKEQFVPELKKLREELTPLLENTEGVKEHGRIGQRELAKAMKESMIYPYASEFGETNNITSQACQASGCYVITTSQAGGTPERVKFGKAIEGDNIYTDKKLQEKFAKECIEYLKNPKKPTEGIVDGFSWATTADSWREIL